MSDETAGNPISEGLGHAARHAAEVAAVLAMGAQVAVRARERQLQARTDRERGVLRAEHAAARLAWHLDPSAPVSAAEATRAWTAAQPWTGRDPAAADAARLAEERLEGLAPDLMDRYRLAVAAGHEPAMAMSTAAAAWAEATVGRSVAAAWAEATVGRSVAAAGVGTPDLPSTRLDEHQQGVTVASGHAGEGDAAAARAAALAALAYPESVTAALGHSPPPPSARPVATARRQAHRRRDR